MTHDDELRALEARLSTRGRPPPPSALRQRIVFDLERARARERTVWLAACAAVLLATIGMRCALSRLEEARGRAQDVVEARQLTEIGIPADEAARWATVLNAARIPATAPWTNFRPDRGGFGFGDTKHERGGG